MRIPHFIFHAVAIALLLSCASQRPPEGGPVDKDPPYVEETVPAQGTTNFTGNEIQIQFNEYVNRQSFSEALHISPLVATKPEIDWSGKDVSIRFPEGLIENRTYVISIGSKLRDVNGNNAMTRSFNLAFSTGDSLDQGSFDGRVFDVDPSGTTILAYQLDRRSADTLNPSVHLPDYAMQTGADGSFRFANVSNGQYRVFALRDRQNNFLYDIESDAIGIPRADITVEDSVPVHLRFLLTTEDTTAPYIQSLIVRDGRYVTVKFNEPIDSRPFPTWRISLRDSTSNARISFLSSYSAPSSKLGYVLYADTQLGDGKYYVIADSLPDAAGNLLILADDSLLLPIVEPGLDSTRPQLVLLEPADNSLHFPADSAIELRFSQPMRKDLVVTLKDSSGTVIETSADWLESNSVLLRHEALSETMRYSLCLDLTAMYAENSDRNVGDSTLCITFTTDSEDDYGTLIGTVIDEDSTKFDAVVTAVDYKATRAPRRKRLSTSGGQFRYERTQPDTYRIEAIIDEDGNGLFSPGKAFPFKPAERFGVYPDTIRVRPRWETKEILIRIPSERPEHQAGVAPATPPTPIDG